MKLSRASLISPKYLSRTLTRERYIPRWMHPYQKKDFGMISSQFEIPREWI
jgi:hypothetical protein